MSQVETATQPPAAAPRSTGPGRTRTLLETVAARAVGIAVLMLAWWFVGNFASQSFPTLGEIGSALVDRLGDERTYTHVFATIRRVFIATVLSVLIGVAVGVGMGLNRKVQYLLRPYVTVALGIPGPVYIIMALLLLGLGETSTMTALVISVVPFVATITYEGAAGRDHKLDEMAAVYNLSRKAHMQHVILAQMSPVLFSALRTGFALSWKLVVLMEALSTSVGIGAQLSFFFVLLQSEVVVAYIIIFVVFMAVIENALFRPLEGKVMRWA